eukprot:CAMPEP_0196661098 /NCGR_PEP_ID=MMETSP1086-20130531/42654_1 /TAXON_ID=77921 /ORGANISM="Cyanoptyche  gloeocystis , Strain SAG4.97" /LENGTH=447 /DNA_ID=CAMNT_0041995849 /DNA_START=67 /DNA_END=1410 /DNA_ORIENTATION=+
MKGEKDWGRPAGGECGGTVGTVLFMSVVPFVVGYFWLACDKFDCQVTETAIQWEKAIKYLMDALDQEVLTGFARIWNAFKIWGIWFALQVLLFLVLPAKTTLGAPTPKGHRLPYKCNGFLALLVSNIAYAVCSFYLEFFPASIVYDNWGSLLVVVNIFSFFLTGFAYFKAFVFPTNDDIKSSGSFGYDLFWGVELNPRIGPFDFKLFFNGRPGIAGWSVINLSFAAAQYRNYGYVTNSMVLVNVFELVYILDFFYNETWYLATLDIMLDHFGFYYAWGDNVWLPWMYSLQGLFLVTHPVQLSAPLVAAFVALNFFAYYVFRAVNNQKRYFRESDAQGKPYFIHGKKAEYITAHYKKPDGTTAESKLLVSGFWGLARHFNYFGDLCMALAWCLPTGFTHLLPYFYIVYMTALLLHRLHRDQLRCSSKYGQDWVKYCKRVPYKLIPYVW